MSEGPTSMSEIANEGREQFEQHVDDWQLVVDVPDEQRDLAEATAQGAANLLGRDVQLMRHDHGEIVFVAKFKPKGKR